MTIEALLVYGSCARGDNEPGSDTDLLALSNGNDYAMAVHAHLNLALYSISLARKMAKSGDLFMLHITEESKALYDPKNLLEGLRASFRYKTSYEEEISAACDLGWGLLEVGQGAANTSLVNKRIAWCTRTVLIARLAEQRQPAFSARALAASGNSRDIARLIAVKDEPKLEGNTMRAFEKFVRQFSPEPPAFIANKSAEKLAREFKKRGNILGAKTLKSLAHSALDFGYATLDASKK